MCSQKKTFSNALSLDLSLLPRLTIIESSNLARQSYTRRRSPTRAFRRGGLLQWLRHALAAGGGGPLAGSAASPTSGPQLGQALRLHEHVARLVEPTWTTLALARSGGETARLVFLKRTNNKKKILCFTGVIGFATWTIHRIQAKTCSCASPLTCFSSSWRTSGK